MTLKTYNTQNAPHKVAPKVSKRMTCSFNSFGRFILGRTLYERMGKPTGVEVCQDTQYPSDFYFKASKNPMAFQIKPGSKNQFCFKSNTMAGIIADAISLPTPPYTVRFKVTEKEDGLFCIGTRQPAISKAKK